ncbi:MAG: type II toxin-antitoxin system prevent-host-death family antitoxin [Chromatiaceae bacterium]|nr:type II toxin-antitoxin system prevent-host-death family antitoxin [Chromatiaceae bacterium]MBP8285099.1 type II toxin-antitoxin system prevent-host-death family antitoxin [Chromatiaceae bacterium]
MQVAIRDLKSHLSHILSRAQGGEAIEVTSHNKPIARIIGIPAGTGEGLRESIARGALSWRGGKPRLAAPVALTTPGTPVSLMVLEDRG